MKMRESKKFLKISALSFLIFAGYQANYLYADEDLDQGLYNTVHGWHDINTVKPYLEKGADPNKKFEGHEYSPFLLAISENKLDIAKLMTAYGAKFDLKNEQDQHLWRDLATRKVSIGYKAELLYSLPAIDFLLGLKTGINTRVQDNENITYAAARWGNPELAKALIKRGGKINIVNKEGQTVLHHLARQQDIPLIKLALQEGVDINAKSNNGQIAVGGAIQEDNAELLKLFLDAGAKLTFKEALNYANGAEKEKTLNYLLNHGFPADLESLAYLANNGRWSLLETAIKKGAVANSTTVEAAISGQVYRREDQANNIQGVVFDAKSYKEALKMLMPKTLSDEELKNLFFNAILKGDLVFVQVLFENKKANLSWKEDQLGNGALKYAVSCGQKEIVEELIRQGADLNVVEGSNKQTPLMEAVNSRHPEMIELLLKHNADPKIKDSNGFTAAEIALGLAGEPLIIKIFADRGFYEKSSGYEQALIAAIQNGDSTLTQSLIAKVGNINAKDGQNKTALAWAVDMALADTVEQSRLEIVEILLKNGADLEILSGNCAKSAIQEAPLKAGVTTNARGRAYYEPPCQTPLMMASQRGAAELIELLFRYHAKPNTKNSSDGQTALMFAAQLGDPRIVRLLLDAGADPTITNDKGQKALDYAQTAGNTKSAKLLVTAAGTKK